MSYKEKNKGVRWYHMLDLRSIVVVGVLFFIAVTQGMLQMYMTDPPPTVDLNAIPAWSGEAWVEVDDNVPYFTSDEAMARAYESYAKLDDWGRCGVANACLAKSLMPTEERGDISSVRPSGWVNKEYDFVDGKMLYNRCHLIGFQLAGENANERNLVTGTRYMNVQGMLPFENMVADHIKEEDHHVLYRVTPVYVEEELVCRGVQMEAYCVQCGEDAETDQDKFMFNVFCYNVQPGVEIDYMTGDNWAAEKEFEGEEGDYVLNTSSRKFHLPTCSGVQSIGEENREEVTCTREQLVFEGYESCGSCNP